MAGQPEPTRLKGRIFDLRYTAVLWLSQQRYSSLMNVHLVHCE